MTAAVDPAARPLVPHPDLTAAAIRAGLSSIAPEFLGSRQLVHEGLSGLAGHPVVVKVETENPVGSFKGRGTWLAIRRLAIRTGWAGSAGGRGVERQLRPGRRVCGPRGRRGRRGLLRRGRQPAQGGPDPLVRRGPAAVGRDFDEARAASEAFAEDGA